MGTRALVGILEVCNIALILACSRTSVCIGFVVGPSTITQCDLLLWFIAISVPSIGAATVTMPTECVNVRVIRLEVCLVSMVSGVLLCLN